LKGPPRRQSIPLNARLEGENNLTKGEVEVQREEKLPDTEGGLFGSQIEDLNSKGESGKTTA